MRRRMNRLMNSLPVKARRLLRFWMTLDAPRDDHGHYFREEGAPCPHEKSTSSGPAVPKEPLPSSAGSGIMTSGAGGHKAPDEIRAYLSGDPQPNRREIRKHIEGTPEYRKYAHNRAGKGLPPPSHFQREDAEQVLREVDAALRSGRYAMKTTAAGETRVFVRLSSRMGTESTSGKPLLTNLVRVSVSLKKGYHYYPEAERELER